MAILSSSTSRRSKALDQFSRDSRIIGPPQLEMQKSDDHVKRICRGFSISCSTNTDSKNDICRPKILCSSLMPENSMSELEKALRSFDSNHHDLQKPVTSAHPTASLKSEERDHKACKMFRFLFSDGKYYRRSVPIGRAFQADVPELIGPVNRKKLYCGDGDSKVSRWSGTRMWPIKGRKCRRATIKEIGKGRPVSCSCVSPGSVDCVKQHIHETQLCLQSEIGPAFCSWKFDEMGESASRSWTSKEQTTFESFVRTNPLSNEAGFWKLSFKRFPGKSKRSIIRYYYNVFIPRRMSLETRSFLAEIDIDDLEERVSCEIEEVDDISDEPGVPIRHPVPQEIVPVNQQTEGSNNDGAVPTENPLPVRDLRFITVKLIGLTKPVQCAYAWLNGEAGEEIAYNSNTSSWVNDTGDLVQVIKFQKGGMSVGMQDPVPGVSGFRETAALYLVQAVVCVFLFWMVWILFYFTMTAPSYTQVIQCGKNTTNTTNVTNNTTNTTNVTNNTTNTTNVTNNTTNTTNVTNNTTNTTNVTNTTDSGLKGVTGFDILNATYFLAVTMSTTGYGDIHPEILCIYAKIAISFLMLIACGFIAGRYTAATNFLTNAFGRWFFGFRGRQLGRAIQPSVRRWYGLRFAIGLVVLFIGIGMIGGGLEGLGWIDSFYLSVTTVTSVGYGDLSHKTVLGQTFAICWLQFGTTIVGIAFGYLSTLGYDPALSNIVFVLDNHI